MGGAGVPFKAYLYSFQCSYEWRALVIVDHLVHMRFLPLNGESTYTLEQYQRAAAFFQGILCVCIVGVVYPEVTA